MDNADIRLVLSKSEKLEDYFRFDLLKVMDQLHLEDKERVQYKMYQMSNYLNNEMDVENFMESCSKYFFRSVNSTRFVTRELCRRQCHY